MCQVGNFYQTSNKISLKQINLLFRSDASERSLLKMAQSSDASVYKRFVAFVLDLSCLGEDGLLNKLTTCKTRCTLLTNFMGELQDLSVRQFFF